MVQINGKLRAKLDVPLDLDKAKLQELALQDPGVSRYLANQMATKIKGQQLNQAIKQAIKKVILVPNKLLNIVI